MPPPSLLLVKGVVQHYAWGLPADRSAVARLAHPAGDAPAEPHAELWMGTHPKGPSVALDGGPPLREALGGRDLPFLFKVLSVGRALSVQAHPDKERARRLHAERPDVYRDPNHKPEMACAVSRFEALCGFRPPEQVAHFLGAVPEFRAAAGEDLAAAFERAVASGNGGGGVRDALRGLFTAVMKRGAAEVREGVEALAARVRAGGAAALPPPPGWSAAEGDLELHELVPRLNEQYPGDVGVFAPFLLNAFALQPGEAVFLGPNEPHAYLDGECVEVMACSDNVVRAGLTPKLRDVDVLCDMLTYHTGRPRVLRGGATDARTRSYPVPVDEFLLSRTALPAGAADYELPGAGRGPELVLVYSGTGSCVCPATGVRLPLRPGSIVAVLRREGDGGGDGVVFSPSPDGGEELVLYRCS